MESRQRREEKEEMSLVISDENWYVLGMYV